MRITHTADIHLKDSSDERWRALKKVIELANEKECDVITISGDLFDNTAQAEKLRGEIRELFANTKARVLIIPGNHDKNVFRSGYFFGENVHIFEDFSKPLVVRECCFWGLPYSDSSGQEVLRKLFKLKDKIESARSEANKHFLLIHTELLDDVFLPSDYGDEGEGRYMPVRLSYFEDIGLDYVLAGHFHTNCSIRKIPPSCFFIYPGSPVSITRKEIGKRKVVFIDTEAGAIDEMQLDSFHFEEINIFLDPFDECLPIDRIKNSLDNLDRNASLILKVSGYIDSRESGVSEKLLWEQIHKLVEEQKISLAEEVHTEYKDVGIILSDDIFKNFNERLVEEDIDPEAKDRLRKLLIKAMTEIL